MWQTLYAVEKEMKKNVLNLFTNQINKISLFTNKTLRIMLALVGERLCYAAGSDSGKVFVYAIPFDLNLCVS